MFFIRTEFELQTFMFISVFSFQFYRLHFKRLEIYRDFREVFFGQPYDKFNPLYFVNVANSASLKQNFVCAINVF